MNNIQLYMYIQLQRQPSHKNDVRQKQVQNQTGATDPIMNMKRDPVSLHTTTCLKLVVTDSVMWHVQSECLDCNIMSLRDVF